MLITEPLQRTLTLILAGGQGERLMPLTAERAKPAVTFGGLYRVIDFTLSNCIHSGLRRINLLTQYQARSLEDHIRLGWNFLPGGIRFGDGIFWDLAEIAIAGQRAER